ncbi:MAG: phage tail tape measure protein [Planctomycetota bacterium]
MKGYSLFVQLQGRDELTPKLQHAGVAMADFGSRTSALGRKLSLGLTAPVVAAGAAVFNFGAKFGEARNRTQDWGKYSGEEMTALAEQAFDVAKRSKASAQEIAESQKNLAGWSVAAKDSLKAIPNIAALATAAEMEMADSTERVWNSLKAYSLGADQAGRLTGMLAMAQLQGKASVQNLTDAIREFGPTATKANIPLEDTVGLLTLLENRQLKGRKAGIALSTMYSVLAARTTQTKQVLSELGFTMAEVYDEAGDPKFGLQFLQNLEKAKPTANQLVRLFGTEQAKRVQALLDGGLEHAKQNSAELAKSLGEDTRQAGVVMQGAVEAKAKLDAAWSQLLFKLGETGALDKMAAGLMVVGDLMGKLADTSPWVLQTGVAVAALGAAFGPALIGIGSTISGLVALTGGASKVWSVIKMGWPIIGKTTGLIKLLFGVVRAHPLLLLAGAIAWVVSKWDSSLSIWENVKAIFGDIWGFVKKIGLGLVGFLGFGGGDNSPETSVLDKQPPSGSGGRGAPSILDGASPFGAPGGFEDPGLKDSFAGSNSLPSGLPGQSGEVAVRIDVNGDRDTIKVADVRSRGVDGECEPHRPGSGSWGWVLVGWRERYLPASFMGVAFHVDNHSRSGSRRLAVSHAPFRDEPVIQDLGQGTRQIRVEAFLLGEDYDLDRKALMAKLEDGMEGLLVHPWLGSLRVKVASWELREGNLEGGSCKFTIQFIVAGALHASSRRSPGRTERTAAVSSAVVELQEAAVSEYSSNLVVRGVAGFVTESAAKDIQEFAQIAEEASSSMVGDLAKFLRRVRQLADNAATRLMDPESLAGDISGIIKEIAQAITSREIALRVLLGLATQRARARFGQSHQAGIAEENGRSTTGLLAGIALGEAANRAVNGDWGSWDEAARAKDRIADVIRDHGDRVTHGVWQRLHALGAALANAIPGPAGELPRLKAVVLDAREPALVVAYRLHGSADQAGDIVGRNQIAHPLFVPAGVPLEVLAHA